MRKKKAGKRFLRILLVFFAIILIITGWMFAVNNIFKFSTYELSYSNLPSSFDGYRIVIVSDMHDRYYGKNGVKLFEAIKSENPDIVLLAGDMHENTKLNNEFYAFLEMLAESYPVYYVEGNHELSFSYKEYSSYTKRIKETGVILMMNDSVLLENGDHSEHITLTGMSWHLYGSVYPALNEDNFNILLYHDPLVYDSMDAQPELMISGHIHGGVIKLPYFGAFFSPGSGATLLQRFDGKYFFPKYSEGIYGDEKKLAVTTGVGASTIPFRFMQPEIMTIILRCEK